jgi:rhodanese-related sulfurtransferase
MASNDSSAEWIDSPRGFDKSPRHSCQMDPRSGLKRKNHPMPSHLSAPEASALLENDSGHVLIDVRHPDRHAAGHPESAASNCVFEVAFLSRMAGLASKESRIILLAEDSDSGEAAAAAGKLERAGYRDVSILSGGYQAWLSAGLPIQGTGETAAQVAAFSGSLPIDTEESRLEWTGRNLINKHWGTIGIADGKLVFENGNLVGGRITLDMKKIACADPAGSPMHDVLIAHLADDDFFDTEQFPTATLELDTFPAALEGPPGGPNLKVSGLLDLRGVRNTVDFAASAGWTTDGRAAAQAAFAIDRTRWGVLYGSGKFFRHLAGHLVNDLIELQVRILTKPR